MSVRVNESKIEATRHSDKRRGHRMNSRVPVRLEWRNAAQERVVVEAHTRVVNPYGCMVVFEEPLELEQRVALTNLATSASNAAIVVWKGNPRQGGWEYGIELVTPEMDFWGLDL
ncbi:MAG: hypothetical protein NVS9B4_10990 [Candidatus Acidiferrum sp.]